MRIDKVNHNPTSGTTSIDYSTIENDGHDHVAHKLKSKDLPHPALVHALRALRSDVEAIAEVGEGYLDTVRGLTIHRDDDNPDDFTITYTATRKIQEARSPLVLNTPAIAPSDSQRQKIVTLLGEAKKFLDGQRAQQDLLGDMEPKPKKKAAAKKKSKAKVKPPPEEPAETNEKPDAGAIDAAAAIEI